MDSMYGGSFAGGRNPPVSYQGQCILGENGYPLIAARVHHSWGTDVQWRRAEVECGLAMDGGLQDAVLFAARQSTQNVVYVDDVILKQDPPDHMNAIKSELKGAFPTREFTYKSLKDGPAPDGAIVIHVATKANSANDIQVPGQPTRTKMFWDLKRAEQVQNNMALGYSWPSLGNRGISRSRSRFW